MSAARLFASRRRPMGAGGGGGGECERWRSGEVGRGEREKLNERDREKLRGA